MSLIHKKMNLSGNIFSYEWFHADLFWHQSLLHPETTPRHDDVMTLETLSSKIMSFIWVEKHTLKKKIILKFYWPHGKDLVLFLLGHSLKVHTFFFYGQITVVHTERSLQEKRWGISLIIPSRFLCSFSFDAAVFAAICCVVTQRFCLAKCAAWQVLIWHLVSIMLLLRLCFVLWHIFSFHLFLFEGKSDWGPTRNRQVLTVRCSLHEVS